MRPSNIHAGYALPLRSVDRRLVSGIVLFLFGLPFIGFPVFFALLLQSGAETTGNSDPLTLGIFLIAFGAVGVGISALGIGRMFYRAEITVDDHGVNGEKRGIRGTEYWSEPLRSYRGVITRIEYRGSQKHRYAVYLLVLKHFRDDDRDVTLVRSLDSIDLRGESEQFARLLGLPVLIETADGKYEVRAAEDLDKSIADLAAAGKLDVPDAPTELLATRSIRSVDCPGGYAFEQNFKVVAISLGAFFFVAGAAVLIGYYTFDVASLRASGWKVSGDPRLAWLAGIVLVVVGLALATAGAYLRQRLDVVADRVQSVLFLGGMPLVTRQLSASQIEEVTVTPKFGMRVVSDHGTLLFGVNLGELELQHVRDATLATLARAAAESPVEPADPKKVRAAQMVILAELYGGNAPASIMDKLERLGNPESAIVEGMRRIAADGTSPHAATLKAFLEKRGSAAPHRPAKTSGSVWGLVDDKAGSVGYARIVARVLQYGIPIVVLAWFLGPMVFPQFFHNEPASNRTEKRAANPQQEAAKKYISGHYGDFDIKPAVGTVYIYIGGRGISAEAHGKDLYVSLGEIRMEKQPGRNRAEYRSLGINVVPTDAAYSKQAKAVWNREIRGVLDTESPSYSLHDYVFVVPGMAAACASPCRARLLLTVQTSPNSAYAENTEFSAFKLSPTTELAKPASEPSRFWDTYYARALSAKSAKRYDESERLFKETLTFIEENLDADHPAAARTLVTMAHIYKVRKRNSDYEQTMIKAYEILDQYSDSEVKSKLGSAMYHVDKEMVARLLGKFYWDQRRYDQGYIYYKYAYDAAPGLQTSDYNRNLKLAFSSAGVMATACVLQKFDEAARAMDELKRRIKSVEPGPRKKLEYWIRTGEPRIRDRQC